MKVVGLNDTKETVVLYKENLMLDNRVAVTKPLDSITFDLEVGEGKALFVKMWPGVIMISTTESY